MNTEVLNGKYVENLDKCCYCILGKDNCPNVRGEDCQFKPNHKGLKISGCLNSRLFKNWIKAFRKDLDQIDKNAKVYLCGGLLRRGFTLGDIDILITSEDKLRTEFSPLLTKWLGKTVLEEKPIDWEHNTQRIEQSIIDIWIYDAYTLPSVKQQMTTDLRNGLVRLRIA